MLGLVRLSGEVMLSQVRSGYFRLYHVKID
jgi:hypothetical protein